MLVARFGAREVLDKCLLLLAVVTALFGFARSVPMLFLWRGLQGLLQAVVCTSSSTILMMTFPKAEELACANSLQGVAVNLGFSFGPALSSAIFDLEDFKSPFMVCAGGLVIWAAVVNIYMPNSPSFKKDIEAAKTDSGDLSTPKKGIYQLRMLLLAGAAAMALLTFGALDPLLVVHFQACLGEGTASSITGMLMTVTGISSTLGAFYTPRLVFMMPAEKLIVLGMLVTSLCCAALAATDPTGFDANVIVLDTAYPFSTQAVLMFVLGFGFSMTWTPVMPLMSATVNASAHADLAASTAALLNGAVALGGAIGPTFGGIVFARGGFIGVANLLAFMNAIFALLLLLLAFPGNSRPQTPAVEYGSFDVMAQGK